MGSGHVRGAGAIDVMCRHLLCGHAAMAPRRHVRLSMLMNRCLRCVGRDIVCRSGQVIDLGAAACSAVRIAAETFAHMCTQQVPQPDWPSHKQPMQGATSGSK